MEALHPGSAPALFRAARSVFRLARSVFRFARSVFRIVWNMLRSAWSVLRVVRNRFPLKRSVLRADGRRVPPVRSVLPVARNTAARGHSRPWRRFAGEWGGFAGEWGGCAKERSVHGGSNMARGGSNYIPRPDGDFNAWQANFIAAAQHWFAAQGASSPLLDAAVDAQKDWDTSYPAHVSAQAAAKGARAEKEQARAAFERAIRPLTNFLQGEPAVSDADRATIGITVRDRDRTPSPTPTSAPVVRVESGQRLTHRLRFTDAAAPTRSGKPRGTIGAEVWLALTPTGHPAPPLGDSYTFLSVSSRGNLQTDFPSADAGKTAYYALRWVSTRGERGPWSEVCSATVAA